MKQIILRDTREKTGWNFAPCNFCEAQEIATLPTGDYTVKGLEKTLCIERKGISSEFCNNIFDTNQRFIRELERMNEFKYPYVILEFTMKDIINFPMNSGIPYGRQRFMKINGGVLLKRFIEVQLQFPCIKFILAGNNGKEFALSLMKRVVENELR